MRKLIAASLFATLCLVVSAPAQTRKPGPPEPAANSSAAALPLRRVILYKNGIGYFEHSTKVKGSQELHIDFTTGQLNDALASLTATDLGGGHITSVRFNSIAPLSERLRALHLPLSQQTSRRQFLNALRGTRVEIQSGTARVTGKLLSVESESRTVGRDQTTENVLVVSIITDAGDLRSFQLGPGVSVRMANGELRGDVAQYLKLIGSERAEDVRRMTITDDGTGARTVRVSYISEVPVWKSTYRILLPSGTNEKPIIQGWAVVDNTMGEDWKNVQLALVSGSPQSFVQDLSTPLYVRRPVVALPHSALLTPQTHEGALMEMKKATGPGLGAATGAGVAGGAVGGIIGGITGAPPPAPGTANLIGNVTDQSGAAIPGARVTAVNNSTGTSQATSTDNAGRYSFLNLPPGTYRIGISHRGFRTYERTGVRLVPNRTTQSGATLAIGSVSQAVLARAAPNAASDEMRQAFRRQTIQATGRQLSEVFEYDIKNPVTIGSNQSALVPILQADLDAQKVTLWNANESVPLRALWITNSSGLVLDAGAFDVLDGATFAGEGLFDTISAGQKRLVSYAADPAIQVSTKESSPPEEVTRIRIVKGMMMTTQMARQTETYRVSDSGTRPRTVIIEHPVRQGWMLAKDLKPAETTESYYRFKVSVKPHESSELEVKETRPEMSQMSLSNVTSSYVALLARQKHLTPEMEAAFRKILDRKNAVAALDQQIQSRRQDVANISKDQDRIRENMKALKGGTEEKQLLGRYVRELNSQEDRLSSLRTQLASLNKQRQQAADALNETISGITLDVEF